MYIMHRHHYGSLFGQNSGPTKMVQISLYRIQSCSGLNYIQVVRSYNHGYLDEFDFQFEFAARIALKASTGK